MRARITRLRLDSLELRLVPSIYWVAPTGDDGATGSHQAPWQTLQHAVDAIAPGDTILVESGTYAGFRATHSGLPDAPMTIQADAGAQVVLDSLGTGNVHNSVVEIDNFDGPVSNWVVDGLDVTNSPSYGIDVGDYNSYITIRNCNVHDNVKTGIYLAWSDHALVEDNVSAFNGEHGIYIANSSIYPTLRGNQVHDNQKNGIHLNGDYFAGGGNGIIAYALVEQNTIYGNGVSGGGNGISCDGVQRSVFQNNLIYNNHTSGLYFYRADSGHSKDDLVVNNTVLVPSNGYWALNIQNGSTGLTVLNNILYNYHSYRGSIAITPDSLPGFTSNNNVVMNRFTLDGGDSILTLLLWQLTTFQDLNSLIADPSTLFVNAGADDYHLAASSPAIGQGTAQDAPDVDIEGNPRPSGGGYDVGAYQHVVTDSGGGDLGPVVALDTWFANRPRDRIPIPSEV